MPCKNILTVDVEDWFHICGVNDYIPRETWSSLESRVTENTSRILNILSESNTLATFFVLGFVAEKCPELVERIHRAGHEIASHGYMHRRVYTMTPDSFRQDLRKSVQVLYGVTGEKVKGFRAPEWSIRDDTLWALDILFQEGFAYDSSMAPLPIIGNSNHSKRPWKHILTHGHIWEVPPLVRPTHLINLPIGGGWGLRTFPYGLIRSRIQSLNHQDQPAVIFLHPREFDPDCPRIKIPIIKRFVLTAAREGTDIRLRKLLRDFEFTSIARALPFAAG